MVVALGEGEDDVTDGTEADGDDGAPEEEAEEPALVHELLGGGGAHGWDYRIDNIVRIMIEALHLCWDCEWPEIKRWGIKARDEKSWGFS